MAGKKKKTKWKKLSLQTFSDKSKEQSSDVTSDSTSSPSCTDSAVETEYDENWTNYAPHQYHQGKEACAPVECYQVIGEGLVDIESPYQWEGQTYYPIYIPHLVPRSESRHQRFTTDQQYYYGLTFPPNVYGDVQPSNEQYCEQQNFVIPCAPITHPVNVPSDPLSTENSDVLHQSSNDTIDITIGGIEINPQTNLTVKNTQEKRKKKKKKYKRPDRLEYFPEKPHYQSGLAQKTCQEVMYANKTVNHKDSDTVTICESDNKEDQGKETFHDQNKQSIEGKDAIEIMKSEIEVKSSDLGIVSETIFSESTDDRNEPKLSEIDNNSGNVEDDLKSLKNFVEDLINQVIISAQEKSIKSKDFSDQVHDYAHRMAEEAIRDATGEMLKNRNTTLSAIAIRRGQNVSPLSINRNKLRRSKKIRKPSHSSDEEPLEVVVPQHSAFRPDYLESMVAKIVNEAVIAASNFKKRDWLTVDKPNVRPKKLDVELNEFKMNRMIDKLADILMYQIIFDAQNDVIKIEKCKEQKAIIGNTPDSSSMMDIDQTKSFEESEKSYEIVSDSKNLTEEELVERKKLNNMEYRDTAKKLKDEEELEVKIKQDDEFRKNGSEIVVYEVSDGSQCGSEDVEVITHRYGCSKDTENRHVFVNQLSLATELLRTDEEIPYDAKFKPLISPSDESGPSELSNENKATNSFILRKYYESLASNASSNRKEDGRTATDSGVHSDESDTGDFTDESASPWWKFGRRFKKSPGDHLFAARDNPFPTGFCCSIM